MASTLADARSILRRCFGYPDFRPGQVDVVEAVLSGVDTLGVLPTGGGKSLCYQVPALTRPGLTVVISPLISLMKDQVDRLQSRGISAALLNSTLSAEDVGARLRQAVRGELKLLYLAPERFLSSDLRRCLQRSDVSLLAVDEAHCISEWGHDFRPSFRRIAEVSRSLGRPQVIALTATATPRVRRDIVRQLDMRSPRTIVGGFDRTNLRYAVRHCRREREREQLLGEALARFRRPAIVYAPTRAIVERVARTIGRAGIKALPYHGGLDDSRRHEVQDAFMRGTVDTIVATNAFGMGIDKPNVRVVVHYAMPGTLEAYYQEAGRAGRDGEWSDCLLLHAPDDRRTHEWFIEGMFPGRASVEALYRRMRDSHCDGFVTGVPRTREAEAGVRLLLRCGALEERRGGQHLHVRLMATPKRIERELSGPDQTMNLAVLRALWRLGGAALEQGFTVNLSALPPALAGRVARAALERLQSRQFVHVVALDEGLRLATPAAPLTRFAIDWEAITRRRANEIEKLDAMEGYVHTRGCRRDFVLRYFGESRQRARCAGCDNCPRR